MTAERRYLLDCAYSYIEQSPQFRLFPVDPEKKLPLIKTGTDHAVHSSTDPGQIERWIVDEFPRCGIACATGAASGIVVIDIDESEPFAELERALGLLPRDRVVRTPRGGLHIYTAHPGTIRVRNGAGEGSPLGKLLCGAKGVDVRADGGMVVLPPSFGRKWIADDDGPFPPLPDVWLAAINDAGEPPPKPRTFTPRTSDRRWSDPERGNVIGKGSRNGELFRRGVALRHAGATDAEILDDLERANAARCQPPLPAREVQTIAASAARADRGHS